uniref:uncharacterized protein LOC132682848 isoform X1 n=1 Tax=Panthera onca TaxID=9690 RepID=UPI002954CC63|nr:uncharacterized protein LOC132682848 isoform X1 [Panthera onca]XP_060494038.1 uncharacterized protein LOC132682848 isoform X1 [Panthera onca]XP_060494039.1 uncharacterized protein LOC132682848 isoform X1 [Panthera onca]
MRKLWGAVFPTEDLLKAGGPPQRSTDAQQHRGRDRSTASGPSDLPARCGGAAGVVNQAVATQRTATSQHQGHTPPQAPAARTLRRLIPGHAQGLWKPSLHAAVALPVRSVDSTANRCPGLFAPQHECPPPLSQPECPLQDACLRHVNPSTLPETPSRVGLTLTTEPGFLWASAAAWRPDAPSRLNSAFSERYSHTAIVHPFLGLSAEVWLLFQNARGLTENSLPIMPNVPDPPLKHTGCYLTVPPERNKRTPGWLNLLRVRLRLRL